MPKVLISAAHTLENPGEIFGDLKEALLTRNILQKVITALEKTNVDFKPVPLDLALIDRIEWINNTGFAEENGDVFIEIHINDGGKRGLEGWYKGSFSKENKSQILTETIINKISEKTKYQIQGIRSEYEHELGSLLILNQIKPTGTAIECLYIDNPEDIKILKDENKLQELANAIASAIEEYVKNPPTLSKLSEPQNKALKTKAKHIPNQDFQDLFKSFSKNFSDPIVEKTQNNIATQFSSLNQISPNNPSSTPLLMDREQRKEMIKKTFKRFLGREPTQTELNLYLNSGTLESELINKLVETKDFKEILRKANEFDKIKEDSIKTEATILKLQKGTKDLEEMNKLLNNAIKVKNDLINKLKQEIEKWSINKNIQQNPSLPSFHDKNNSKQKVSNGRKKTSFLKKIIKFFKRLIGLE